MEASVATIPTPASPLAFDVMAILLCAMIVPLWPAIAIPTKGTSTSLIKLANEKFPGGTTDVITLYK